MRRVLVVDHRDSFVFNLVEDLARLGCELRCVRGDVSLERLEEHRAEFRPDLVLLSPGPGHPDDAGVMPSFLRRAGDLPVLGVCLGMQGLVRALGGDVVPGRPVHGRPSRIHHEGDPLFEDVPTGFLAGRYHSLRARSLPAGLRAVAWCSEPGDETAVMAVRHEERPWTGLQFHPESVLTPEGARILRNALRILS